MAKITFAIAPMQKLKEMEATRPGILEEYMEKCVVVPWHEAQRAATAGADRFSRDDRSRKVVNISMLSRQILEISKSI